MFFKLVCRLKFYCKCEKTARLHQIFIDVVVFFFFLDSNKNVKKLFLKTTYFVVVLVTNLLIKTLAFLLIDICEDGDLSWR